MYRSAYNNQPLFSMLRQTNPIHALQSIRVSLKISFNVLVPSTYRSSKCPLFLQIHPKPYMYFSQVPRMPHAPPITKHSNNKWGEVQIIKFPITRTSNQEQHPVVQHPKPTHYISPSFKPVYFQHIRIYAVFFRLCFIKPTVPKMATCTSGSRNTFPRFFLATLFSIVYRVPFRLLQIHE